MPTFFKGRSQELAMLLPAMACLVLIIITIQALKLFTQVSVMTKGGPNGSSATIIYHLFQQGFTSQKIGYASAISVFFIAVTTIAVLQRVFLKNEGEQ